MMDHKLIVPGPRTKSALALAERHQRHQRRSAQRAGGQRKATETTALAPTDKSAMPVTPAPVSPPRVYAKTISEVSQRMGLTHRAIRLYEEMGLITCARGPKNMRVLDSEAQARLQAVADLKTLGLTISEIVQLLSQQVRDPRALRGRIEAQLEALDRQRAVVADYLSRLPPVDALAPQGAR